VDKKLGARCPLKPAFRVSLESAVLEQKFFALLSSVFRMT